MEVYHEFACVSKACLYDRIVGSKGHKDTWHSSTTIHWERASFTLEMQKERRRNVPVPPRARLFAPGVQACLGDTGEYVYGNLAMVSAVELPQLSRVQHPYFEQPSRYLSFNNRPAEMTQY